MVLVVGGAVGRGRSTRTVVTSARSDYASEYLQFFRAKCSYISRDQYYIDTISIYIYTLTYLWISTVLIFLSNFLSWSEFEVELENVVLESDETIWAGEGA